MSWTGRILVVSFFAAASTGCDRRSAPDTSRILPDDDRKSEAKEPEADERGFLGLVVAPETVDLTSQLEARITEIGARPGDRVARGAILARLDTRTARHELEIARADLASARSESERMRLELAQAQDRLERRETVVELPSATVGLASGEEVSTSRYQQKIAAARLTAAQANIAAKEAHFKELNALYFEGAVRAPFDGAVVARYADVGAMIHKGAPIVRLLGTGEQRVRFAIPEESADEIALDDTVRIVLGDVTLVGRVERVAPEIDSASRMIFAEASFDATSGANGRIRVGQLARVFARERDAHASR